MIRNCMYVEGLDRGGIETFCLNLIEPLREAGCETSFLVLKEKDYACLDTVLEHGCRVDYLVPRSDLASATPRAYCAAARKWARSRCADVDIMHMHISQLGNSLPLMLAARVGGVKNVVLHAHTSRPFTKKIEMMHEAARPFLSVFPPSALLACSKVAGDWMFGNHAYNLVANGIDVDRFSYNAHARAAVRRELGLGDRTVLCCVGRFAREKNHSFLLDVFKAFHDGNRNSTLLLVGSGELEADLRRKAQDLGILDDTIFTGLRSDIPDILSASDCLVFPSLFEGLSLACVEAQANGIPAVFSDGVSSETVMSDKTVVASLSSPPSAWADVISEQVKRRHEKPRFTEEFSQYDIRFTAQTIAGVYERALAGR